MAFGVGAAAAPGHGAPGAAARTRVRRLREFPRVLRATRLPLTPSTDALAPRAPTPNAGAARVLGRAPRPRTSAKGTVRHRPYGIPRRRPRPLRRALPRAPGRRGAPARAQAVAVRDRPQPLHLRAADAAAGRERSVVRRGGRRPADRGPLGRGTAPRRTSRP